MKNVNDKDHNKDDKLSKNVNLYEKEVFKLYMSCMRSFKVFLWLEKSNIVYKIKPFYLAGKWSDFQC